MTESYGAYVAPHTLEMCYDMRNSSLSTVLDTSHRKKEAEVKDCDRVFVNQVADFVEIPIPYRRESTFKLLYHKENGFYENKWTWTETRKNQLYFYNKVLKGKSDYKRDGVDNVRFELLSDTKMDNYYFISVEL